MVSISFVGLPNLLAGKALVPELLQSEATPEKLARVLRDLLASTNEEMIKEFYHWHHHLRRNANEAAANAVLALINEAR
jgi:lipid-A-disaccharide synthase